MKNIKVIILRASSDVLEVVENFEHTLENMQSVVGGLIEAITLKPVNKQGREITLWANEEGKLINLPPNFAIMDGDGELLDIVMGDVLITATNEMRDTDGLTDAEIEFVQKSFNMRYGLYAPVFVTKTLFV